MVRLIKWSGLGLEIAGKALQQADIEDALLESVREGADRWFGKREEATDEAAGKLRNQQIETLVSKTKSHAFRLALADAVSGVVPVLAVMLIRRTRFDRVSFIPEGQVARAIQKHFFKRLSESAEMEPLKESQSHSLLYDLLIGDSLRALRIAAQKLPVRDGWFSLRKRWGYHLGSMEDIRVFLIGYDDTFDWGNSGKGTFFTFYQKGAVRQVEEYISKRHLKLREDVKRASITLAQKSQADRTTIWLSFSPGVESIYSDGYSTQEYLEKEPKAKVYSDVDLISSPYRLS